MITCEHITKVYKDSVVALNDVNVEITKGEHKIGVRAFMQPFVMNNRGALFAAANQPDKILDGVELKGDKFLILRESELLGVIGG